MYDPDIVWYNKVDVLSIFPINERTYFRKLKKINSLTRITTGYNNQGKKSKLIYFEDLLSLFEIERIPTDLSDKSHRRKYIGTRKWDYIGNIIPSSCEIITLKFKMKYIFKLLKEMDKTCFLFYSIENNTQDSFYHSHFLIKTTLKKSEIHRIISFCVEENTSKETRIYLQNYDYPKHHFRGSFYSFKIIPNKKGERSFFDEILNN
jgi:hypothetical protein